MKIYHKRFEDWSPRRRLELMDLTLRPRDGGVSGMTKDIVEQPEALDTLVCIEDGKVIGWATIDEDNEANFYVAYPHRRRGVGTKLVARLRSIYEIIHVMHWDRQSGAFYRKVGL